MFIHLSDIHLLINQITLEWQKDNIKGFDMLKENEHKYCLVYCSIHLLWHRCYKKWRKMQYLSASRYALGLGFKPIFRRKQKNDKYRPYKTNTNSTIPTIPPTLRRHFSIKRLSFLEKQEIDCNQTHLESKTLAWILVEFTNSTSRLWPYLNELTSLVWIISTISLFIFFLSSCLRWNR